MRTFLSLLGKPLTYSILVFLALAAPFSLGALFVAPSEMFYTDAAIEMLRTGDFFTPYFDEDLRFQKPILTYWWVVAVFQVLGIDYWTSRLPFLLGGAALLGLTYRLSLLVAPEKRQEALLAFFLLAAHPLLVLSASRAMPDLPLVLFTTLGAYGALGMLRFGGAEIRYSYYFYLGFALSIATKGIPGLILCGITVFYMLLNPFGRLPWQRVLRPVPILLGLLIAFSWYGYMYILHQDVFLDEFFKDQVGGRVIKRSERLWVNISRFLTTLAYAAPAFLLALLRGRQLKTWFQGLGNMEKSLLGVFLAWFAFFAITAPFFLIFYDRYIFSMLPLQAVLLAFVLSAYPLPKADQIGKSIVFVLYAISLLALLAACFFFYDRWEVWLGIPLNGLLFYSFWRFKSRPLRYRVHLLTALLLLGIYTNVGSVLIPVVHPESAKQAAEYLLEKHSDKLATHRVVMVEWKREAAKFRIAADNRFRFERTEDLKALKAMTEERHLLVLPEKYLELLEKLPQSYTVEPASLKYRALYRHPFLKAFLKKEERFYVALPTE